MTSGLDQAAPPWSVRLTADFRGADERAVALARTLTPAQLNWAPQPGVWSIGQCLEHLFIANEVYLRAMSASLAGQPDTQVPEITPRWFGRWFIRNYIEPSGEIRRSRAPNKITPGGHVDSSILDRFLKSNDEARALVHRAAHYDVNRIRFKNPFVPMLRFTVGTGLEILSKHQDRHLRQAERVKALAQAR